MSGYQFKFSIIMAVYNVEDYLGESVDSIVKQTLNFKDNIQLILVDDGSKDRSVEIAREYERKYPENVIVIEKENGGQASARNIGLKYAKGKYVNFLDSDDYISRNTLKDVYDFFEAHDGEIDIVAIPMMLFERVEGPHRLNYKFETSRVINLDDDPNNPLLSSSSSFIRYDSIKDYEFDTELVNLEDALIISKILLEKRQYGVINTANYYYRQRITKNSTVDGVESKKRYYTDRLKGFYLHLIDYCMEKCGEVPLFIQYLMAYDLQWLLRVQRLEVFDSDEEIKEFRDTLDEVLSYIKKEVVYDNENITFYVYPFFLYMLGEEKFISYDDDLSLNVGECEYDIFTRHKIWLDIVEIKNNMLNISGIFLSGFLGDNITIKLIVEDREYECRKVKYNTPERNTHYFLDIVWKYCTNFDVSIPITPNKKYSLKFMVNYTDDSTSVWFESTIGMNHSAPLSDFSAYMVKKPYMVLFQYSKLHVLPYNPLMMLKYEYSNVKKILSDRPDFFMYSVFMRIIYFILYPFYRNRRIWLFNDRPEFADDNAKHLFKYSVAKNDGIKKYFVVKKNSESFAELKRIDKKIVPFNSLKHRVLYLFAENIISSYVNDDFTNPFFDKKPELYAGFKSFSQFFLQHGVTKDDISRFVKKYNHNLSMIVTVSDYERESFLKEGYNYDESIIPVVGFPRYDNLKSNLAKKQILFMPTWRLQFDSENSFVNSDYYSSLHDVLNNSQLLDLIENEGYKLVFKPHAELVKYFDLLTIDERVAVSRDDSYQDLFNSSQLLITDFSSVFFDFAYLKKPVIYFQPNDDYHYDDGYFDYETMGFGEVIKDNSGLFLKIRSYLNNGCIMEDEFKDNVDKFFKYTDKNNSKRVYEWILEHS
ncbi:MAG: glycosyltransferase [Methanobrevibacter thaueri]|nr:glycosyltransferase [Methanobrevibacter thaueri]